MGRPLWLVSQRCKNISIYLSIYGQDYRGGSGPSPVSVLHRSAIPKCAFSFRFHSTQSSGPFKAFIFEASEKALVIKEIIRSSYDALYLKLAVWESLSLGLFELRVIAKLSSLMFLGVGGSCSASSALDSSARGSVLCGSSRKFTM